MSFHVVYSPSTHSITVTDQPPRAHSAWLDAVTKELDRVEIALRERQEWERQNPGKWGGPPDSVTNENGVAVFRRGGSVVAVMPWDDYETMCQEVETR